MTPAATGKELKANGSFANFCSSSHSQAATGKELKALLSFLFRKSRVLSPAATGKELKEIPLLLFLGALLGFLVVFVLQLGKN
jgi:hypothetical protein